MTTEHAPLSDADLAAIEARSRVPAGNRNTGRHLPHDRHNDVPRLVAEVRRLREELRWTCTTMLQCDEHSSAEFERAEATLARLAGLGDG